MDCRTFRLQGHALQTNPAGNSAALTMSMNFLTPPAVPNSSLALSPISYRRRMPSVAEVSFTCDRYLQQSASVPEVSSTCDRYQHHLASVAEVSYTCVRYLQHAQGQ